jgi:hypothetical protein
MRHYGSLKAIQPGQQVLNRNARLTLKLMPLERAKVNHARPTSQPSSSQFARVTLYDLDGHRESASPPRSTKRRNRSVPREQIVK